ncbi:MAG TPA: phosphatase PAP2 family protein [Allosphingosinicella sp.]|nr:phosphatase PAP2 family protein [Allosphingosinicella sp.]
MLPRIRASDLLIALPALLWLAMLILGGPGSRADGELLHLFHWPGVVPAALGLTRLGNVFILLPLSLAAAAAVWRGLGRKQALLYLLLILSGRLLEELQKDAIGRARPDPAGRLDRVASFSFPSAHAANSTIAWLGLALIAAPPRYRSFSVAAALLLALLVGLTRLVLAVHWPSDVIGGWAFGAAWTLLLLRVADGMSPQRRPSQ